MIDHATIERIKDAANIVEVVSEFVTLRKSGSNYKGLCPFHDEKTPSFYVSPARGTCHCFGCGKGGNPVGFIMEHEQMTYPEALRWLARKYHIEIKERELSDDEKREQSERESMFIVNEWAASYFQHLMHDTADGVAIGMQYFRSRGFRDDIVSKFQLGFDSTDRRALAQEALRKGYKEDFLLKTGICYKNDRGELIDRYAGRVIFPWIGISGKVVGFGGRLLDSRTKGVNQKYVNSPDSEIYHKDRELYGIYQAKKAIAKEDRVYMVEGYTDVISMHQCGIENVVANSGTALSVHQIHILHRFTSNITLLYDGDAAGIHAALRGTDMLLSEGMNLKVLLLPDGDDPDSFARKHSAEDFRKYIEEHQTDFIEFKTDLLLRNERDPLKRSEAINSVVRSISFVTNPILRDTYLHDCSVRMGINEATLINTLNNFIRSNREETASSLNNSQSTQTATQNSKLKIQNGIVRMLNAHRIAFIASPHVDNTTAMKTNQAEAEMIAATVMQIYRSTADRFDEAQTVGIIVPYRNQIATIRSAIDAAYRTMYGDADTQQAEAQRNKLHNITIDTVERYQGSQRDYIIYGFTVRQRYQLDFLTNNTFEEDAMRIDRKLNVAMTRARLHMLMVGNPEVLRQDETFSRLIDFAKHSGAYYDIPVDKYCAGDFPVNTGN